MNDAPNDGLADGPAVAGGRGNAEGHIEVGVRVPKTQADLIETLLLGQDALAVTLTDAGDMPLLEPGVGETPLWDDVVLIGLFPGDADEQRVRAALSLLVKPTTVTVRRVRDQAWERAWMDRFEPMQFGERLWIVPTGMTPPDPDGHLVRLDPGLAFGTGTHPTTRLCLEWLDALDLRGRRVIDYGCGSGVLGIAAAVKGAARVLCVDNDPQAVTATRENASHNGVDERLQAVEAHALADRREQTFADVVVANILAGTLIELADELSEAVALGGRLALSGVLREQASEVAAAFDASLGMAETAHLDGWSLVSGRRTAVA